MTSSDKLLKRILTEMDYVDLVSGERSPFPTATPYIVIDSKLELSQDEYDLIELILKEDNA